MSTPSSGEYHGFRRSIDPRVLASGSGTPKISIQPFDSAPNTVSVGVATASLSYRLRRPYSGGLSPKQAI
jgi:hypothetical protein